MNRLALLKKPEGETRPAGELGLSIIKNPATIVPPKQLSLREIYLHGFPHQGLPREINDWRWRNLQHLKRGLWKLLLARRLKLAHLYGQLSLAVIRKDGQFVDLGLASLRVVTNAGVDFIVDAFQNSVELEILKYHGIGTGSTAENATDTALVTELTTQYSTDNTRATGSLTEGGSTNVFRSVGTNTVDAAVAIQEHGILSQAATGGGTLLDRTVFSTINLANGDSLQSTYDLTITAGS